MADSSWAYITDRADTAHHIAPAGGDDTWRTGCGRIFTATPLPAGQHAKQCRRCLDQLAGNPNHRPVIVKAAHRA